MYKQIIKNLPFNPGLIGTLSFYAKRMKQEESLRRLGFLFVALAMFIQMFAVIAPPEKSLAYSNDYIINGLQTRDDILRAWDGKTSDKYVAEIYSKFGITREDILKLTYSPNVTIKSTDADYWTIGRTSLSAVSKADQIKAPYKSSEIPVNTGSTTVYLRQLQAWDIRNPYNSYRAFEGVKNGQKFWILVDCGNFTQVGQPNLTEPGLQLRKTIDGGPRTLKPGEEFSFRFEYRNNIENSQVAKNVVLYDQLDLKNFDIVNPTTLNLDSNNLLTYPIGDVGFTENYKTALVIRVRLKNSLPTGTKTCNTAKLSASNAADAWSGGDGLCITVNNPCPLDIGLDKTDTRCTEPKLVCVVTESDLNRTTKEFTLKTTTSSSNEYLTRITGYEYDFGDGSQVLSSSSSSYTDTVKHTYADGDYDATVVVNYQINKGDALEDGSVACVARIESEPDKPLSQNKTAQNLTQNLDTDTTPTTTAQGGDIIEYTLITHNSYGYDRVNVATSDYIGDLLDYADLDMAFLDQQGGTYNKETMVVNWGTETVPANSDMVKKFRVKIKDPVPATNQPSTLTASHDCTISNKFGDQLDIPIKCPIPKSAEYITKRLPNTGPGTSLIIGFAATTIVAYYFARSRLLAQELDIIRTDFAQTGGV